MNGRICIVSANYILFYCDALADRKNAVNHLRRRRSVIFLLSVLRSLDVIIVKFYRQFTYVQFFEGGEGDTE